MTDFYIDAVNGANGNSGADADHPKQFISQANFATGVRVFLKRGQIHPVSTYRFFNSNMILDCYGTGELPTLQKTAGGDAWLYIQNVDNVTIRNIKVDGNGYSGSLITIKPTTAGHSGHLIENVEAYGSPAHFGLYVEGSATAPVTNVTVRNCIFRNNGYHGVLITEQVSGCLVDSCIAYGNGWAVAGHGFSTYSAGASPHVSGIVFRNCISYGTIDLNGQEGAGFQFDNYSTNCSFIGCLSYNNQGAGYFFNAGSGHSIIGCIGYGNYKAGVVVQSTTGSFIYNNTLVGNCRSSASYSSEIKLQTNSTSTTINNNILSGSDTKNPTGIAVEAGSDTSTTATTNRIYGFTTAASGITPTSTTTTDPLFVNSTAKDYRLSSGSTCIGTGTVCVSLSDFNGKEFNNPPDIGAIGVRSARAVVSRTVASRGAAGN